MWCWMPGEERKGDIQLTEKLPSIWGMSGYRPAQPCVELGTAAFKPQSCSVLFPDKIRKRRTTSEASQVRPCPTLLSLLAKSSPRSVGVQSSCFMHRFAKDHLPALSFTGRFWLVGLYVSVSGCLKYKGLTKTNNNKQTNVQIISRDLCSFFWRHVLVSPK